MKARRQDISQIGRLLKRADFLRVQAAGRKWVTPLLIVQLAPLPAEKTGAVASPPLLCRLGMTVTKKIFPNAVDRNRVRRRLRALVLSILAEQNVVSGWDVVVLPRTPALTAPGDMLEKDLKWAFKRLISPDYVVKTDEKPTKKGKKVKKPVRDGEK